jgi:hypothetical protein
LLIPNKQRSRQKGFLLLPPWMRSGSGGGGGGGGGDFFDFPLPSANYEPSVITQEIIAPRTGLASWYRYYKAYPGVLYEVPISVLGGAAPHYFELLQAPPGMTIGNYLRRDYLTNGPQAYGLIQWSNPTTSGSPHTIEVRVTDQVGTQTSVTWSLTVTTSGFIFLDRVNGNRSSANGGTGTGTIGNPFLDIRDWYAGATGGTGSSTKNDTTYQGYIVYYRGGGTYSLNDAYLENGGTRLTCTSAKPAVHLGYPGETASIAFGPAQWNCENEPIYLGELSFTDLSNGKAQNFRSAQNNFVAFKINCDAPITPGATGSNGSIFFAVESGSEKLYHTLTRSEFAGADGIDLLLAYGSSKWVIDWNTVIGAITGGNCHGIYLKDANRNVSARFNRAEHPSNNTHLFRIDGYNNDFNSDNFDLIFNSAKSTADCVQWGNNGTSVGTTAERRNTWNGGNPARLASNAGTLNSARNVIRYVTSPLTAGAMTVNTTDNLQATSGLIDSSNLLTGADRTNYLGIRGHEISD